MKRLQQFANLSAADIAERKEFLELTAADADTLRGIHDALAAHREEFSTAFYRHLLSYKGLAQLLPNAEAVERLKRSQAEYFSQLTEGDYGDGYVVNRLKVGEVHYRVGLEPRWYIGAYRKYLANLLPWVWQAAEGEADRFMSAFDALLKVVMFDMELALVSYFAADRQAILELKQYAEQIVRCMPTGLIVLDDDLRIRTINRAACRMLGSEQADLVGRALQDLMPADAILPPIEALRASGAHQHEIRIELAAESGGRVIELGFSDTTLEEKPLTLAMLEDVTERSRAEEIERRFRVALDSAQDAIYLIDRETMRFLDANEPGYLGLGYSREELLAMGPQDIKPYFSRERLAEEFDTILHHPQASGVIETFHRRRDGALIPVEIQFRGFYSEGRPLLVALARDMSARLEAQAELLESQERFRATFEQAAVGLAHVAPDGRWLRANQKLCEILGYSRDELLGKTFQEITHPEDLKADLAQVQHMLAGELDHYSIEKRYLRRDGSFAWTELTVSLVRDERGQPKYFISVIDDIGLRKETEETLRLLKRAVESSGNGIVLTDCRQADNPIVYVNPAFERMTGYAREEVLGRNCRFLQGGDRDQEGVAALRTGLAEQREVRVVLRNYRKDGSLFWNELYMAPVRGGDGRVTHYIGVQNDITESKQNEAALQHMATHDSLTGLPNRALLQDRIGQAIAFAARCQQTMAVLFIDLDRFKNINDSLGHDVGDHLVTAVAERLQSAVRGGDTVARIGGDEFVVLLADLAKEDDAAMVADSLLKVTAKPIKVAEHELYVTASLGISLYPRDGENATDLLKNADTAMYQAKEAGRNGFRFYTQEMNVHAVDRLRLENDLRRALERDELVLHYQPQVLAGTGEIVAAEALLRWQHPERGMISPAEFIPLAEDTGLIVPIGEWVLWQVAGQVRAWRQKGLAFQSVAVNLSPRQFRQHNIVAVIDAILDEYGEAGNWLELEITEGVLMQSPEQAIQILQQLSERGVHLAIDDFGTGYSSLSYLQRFPIDALKIDRSFVHDLEHSGDSAAIASAVVALAHRLDLQVVAEGVETQAQLDYLRELGCDLVQGYLCSRPVPVADFEGLVRRGPCLR